MSMLSRPDDPRLLRRRTEDLELSLSRLQVVPDDGANCITGRTVLITTYPTGSGKYVGVNVSTITGIESEGSTVSIGIIGTVILALSLGTVPDVGTDVICTRLSGRWVID